MQFCPNICLKDLDPHHCKEELYVKGAKGNFRKFFFEEFKKKMRFKAQISLFPSAVSSHTATRVIFLKHKSEHDLSVWGFPIKLQIKYKLFTSLFLLTLLLLHGIAFNSIKFPKN